MDTYEGFRVSKSGPILDVLLSRPEVRNAITSDMERCWDRILDEAEADDEVRVVTLRGEGSVFSAGHDLKGQRSAADRAPRFDRFTAFPSVRSWYFPKPVIAGVQGYVGPAANWMISGCDFVIAANDTRFSFENSKTSSSNPEASAFPLLFPVRVVKKLFMMGGWMDADQALEFHYVQRVVAREELDEEVDRWAAYLAQLDPGAVQGTKRAIHRSYELMGFAAMVGLGDRTGRVPGADVGEFARIAREKGLKEALQHRDSKFASDIAKV